MDNATRKRISDLMKQAEKHAAAGGVRMEQALSLYEQAHALAPSNTEVNLGMGLAQLNGPHRHAALPYLEQVAANEPDMPRIHFLLGYARQLNADWDGAIAAFEQHKRAQRGFADEQDIFNTADRKIIECRNGRSLMAAAKPFLVENMGPGINSPSADHGVLVTADGERMLFTSRRGGIPGAKLNKATNDHFDNIYTSLFVDGRWSEPSMIPAPVNAVGNNAAVGLFNDGRTVLLYRDEGGAGDIWETKRRGDEWSEPRRLGPNINTIYHESSAWFSFDRQWLYFVSDRPDDNVGGQDIYRSRWDEAAQDWGPAENLGPEVNSSQDEDGIFVHPDGRTIYFSSKGHGSMGGYDIFRSSLGENGRWSKPESMGWPINSPDDDLFFVLTADGSTGYFTSVRKGGLGEDDIYRVDMTVGSNEELTVSAAGAVGSAAAEGASTVLLKGKVLDLQMLNGMEADLDLMDLEDGSLLARFNSDPKTGEYMVAVPAGRDYALHIKANGFLMHSEHVTVPEGRSGMSMDLDVRLSELAVGSEVVMRNIFFDTNKATLKSGSTAELKQLLLLLSKEPGLRLEVSGHTDSDGSDAVNQRLSEQRAAAVKQYLVSNGVDAGRLEAKGYGSSKPIAPNDNAEGKARNRRTEIRVVAR